MRRLERRIALFLGLFLLVVSGADSQTPTTRPYAYPVQIPRELRARNYKGHCVWCCLQTVARHQNVSPLFDILKEVDRDPAVAADGKTYFETVHELLLKRKIAHYFQPRGQYTWEDLYKAIQKGVGVIVSLNNDGKDYSHAVILAGYWRDWVSYYDPDGVEKVWDMKREEFDRRWNGQVLFLDYLVPRRTVASPRGASRRLLAAEVLAGKKEGK